MKKLFTISVIASFIALILSFKNTNAYNTLYTDTINDFNRQQHALLDITKTANLREQKDIYSVKKAIVSARLKLKAIDFWLRYLEPVAYKKINGALPVEWENEVFEKFEKPYKREGAGLSLAELYLEEENINNDSLVHLIQSSIDAMKTFRADSITSQLSTPDHFFFANRLYLLNLAAVYTTGFECPDTGNIIPELRYMLEAVTNIYDDYNKSFAATPLPEAYLDLYQKTILFAKQQPSDFSAFDHFSFIKNYVNPLFAMNQKLINAYGVISENYNDYTLNDSCYSIFNKSLYTAQTAKGIFSVVDDTAVLEKIKQTGKLLFYDPLLSGNNKRSCASCHKPDEYFTDTSLQTAFQFDDANHLTRNTPSLINVVYNHLIMLDGKHISLTDQTKDVITNPKELNNSSKELLEKVLSCKEYKDAFKAFLKYTPEKKQIGIDHIISAITYYYGAFGDYYAAFDEAMNANKHLDEDCIKGFNLFMSKAKCATCHFLPNFNGVKPPFISSEFEVLGIPEDTGYIKLSGDSGRFYINPADETLHAFRTGSLRNIMHTAPYMHNGVFKTIEEVIEFYNDGGGAGKKLDVQNQTLPADSLKLNDPEKQQLLSFLHSLDENIIFEEPPSALPVSSIEKLNQRKVGGEY
ncbi:MAG TPA: cytochrome c peroxidase [Parafilimonas sp.]|nr:cytochrome c peroxidase [Parafilimonas sp.]